MTKRNSENDAKLTLKLDKRAVNRAKEYAERNQTNLTDLVENFFKTLTGPTAKASKQNAPTVIKP